MDGRSALIVDVENVVATAYHQLGATGAAAYLRWVHRYVASRTDVRWSIGAACGLLPLQLLPTFVELGIRLRTAEPGPNRADDILIRRGADVPRSVDRAVLLTGDEDFLPLVQRLQRRGVHVVVASAPEVCSRVLRMAANEHWPLPNRAMLSDTVLAA